MYEFQGCWKQGGQGGCTPTRKRPRPYCMPPPRFLAPRLKLTTHIFKPCNIPEFNSKTGKDAIFYTSAHAFYFRMYIRCLNYKPCFFQILKLNLPLTLLSFMVPTQKLNSWIQWIICQQIKYKA